jgi:DNA-binding transcriptional LysR family regulator
MQLNKVDLNLFLVFDVIYRERNLTKAAETLHITQPAVSNALSRLRNTYNDKLFVRQSGNMVPTPLAENIIERVRLALVNLESSLYDHDDFDPATSRRRFSFSMNDTSESYLLPLLMAYLQKEAPGIYIESYAVQLTHQELTQDRFICVARKNHPEIQDSLTLEQYLHLPHIHISSRRKGQGYIDLHLNRLGLQRNILLRVQHSRAAPPIVAKTNMLLTIPESLARDQDNLQIFDLPFDLPKLDWHLYWPSNYSNDKAHRWMREAIFRIFTAGGME